MANDRFIDERKSAWQRLEDLLSIVDRTALKRLQREEVRELGCIYRRTASDLAIARAESRDPRLINYLNSLVIRAHGRIYRADAQGSRRVLRFFTHDFPQTFRRTWKYTAAAFTVFIVFSGLFYFGTYRDPEFSELAGVPAGWRETGKPESVAKLNNRQSIVNALSSRPAVGAAGWARREATIRQ